jgi:NAD(P)H-dependent FMN reductase
MSAPGLRNFLDGGTPRRSTFRKLSEWYVREAATAGDVSDETVQAALALVLEGVPENGRADAARTVLDAIRTAYQKQSVPLPEWWERLLRQL